jgi:small-conductance mechanosensitive channel
MGRFSGSLARVTITIGLDADSDGAALDEAVRALRAELLALEVEDVARAPGEPPPQGARAVDGPVLDTLIVTLGGGALTAMVRTVEYWLRRASHRRAKLQIGEDTIELTGLTDDAQRELVEAFLARHAPPPP